jgi:hypothetical protein
MMLDVTRGADVGSSRLAGNVEFGETKCLMMRVSLRTLLSWAGNGHGMWWSGVNRIVNQCTVYREVIER